MGATTLKASRYKGVSAGPGDRWAVRFKQHKRGPFDFEEEASVARKIMVFADRDGKEMPSTEEIRDMLPDLSQGRERPKPMAEVLAEKKARERELDAKIPRETMRERRKRLGLVNRVIP